MSRLSRSDLPRLIAVTDLFRSGRIVFPWEDIVGLCRKYDALSLVDAAHAIGQIKVDVKKADCDFWVAVSYNTGTGKALERMLTFAELP